MNTMKTTKSTIEVLKKHRKALLEQRSNVASLEQLVTEHEVTLGTLESAEEAQAAEYGDLQREREDVLADIALSRKSDSDLAEVDRRISEMTRGARGSQGAKETAELLRAEQRLEGLRRRKSNAEDELRQLEESTPAILQEFLIADAAEVYAAYLANAGKAIADMKRLLALGMLYEKTSGDKSRPFTKAYYEDALLPTFSLPHDGAGADDAVRGILFKTNMYLNSGEADTIMAEETDRLRALGIFDLA